jgi:hypothetical protein
VARVDSISRPKGTLDGQAVSQPRHCTHVSIESTNDWSTAKSCHCTWRIAEMRPRGERDSSPVTRYVGQ